MARARSKSAARIGAQNVGELLHDVGDRRRIVGKRMRQHDRMGFGMRQVEAAPERVAELVVQRHADRSQADATEPRTVERIGTGITIVWPWQ